MPIKTGFLALCFLADIALGIYTYFNFESLLVRFMLFTFTTIFVAMLVIKLAGPVEHESRKTFSENFSKEQKGEEAKEQLAAEE